MVPPKNLNPSPSPRVGILSGPTASGKTAIALAFASDHPQIEMINADSIQVFRGFDIGSAKPTLEERQKIRHHLIDIRDPEQDYNAADFVQDCRDTLSDIHRRGKRALIVGGTGFYLKTLLYGFWSAVKSNPKIRKELETHTLQQLYQELAHQDPEAAKKINPNDRYRLIRSVEILRVSGQKPSELERSMPRTPDPLFELWVMDRDKTDLLNRIESRTEKLIDDGMIDETRDLLERFPRAKGLQSVGYQQICDFLNQRSPSGRKLSPGIPGLMDEIVLATRQMVKAQRTWFRSQKSATHFLLDSDRHRLDAAMNQLYRDTTV